MKIKLKTCSGCGEEKPIWKNHEGDKYCKYCWQIHNPKNKDKAKNPIKIADVKKSKPRQKSKRREAEDLVYSQLRKVFLFCFLFFLLV